MSNENLIKIVSDGSRTDETISCCKLKLGSMKKFVVQTESGIMKILNIQIS